MKWFGSLKTDKLLKARFLSGIPYMYSYTAMQQLLYSSINARLLTFMDLFSSIFIILINDKWSKLSDKGDEITKKIFKPLLIIETISYGILVVLYFINRNMIIFYILNSLMHVFITQNISSCMYYIQQKRYGKERAEFDINMSSIGCAIAIIGYIGATIIPPTIEVSFICFYLATILDNVYQLIVLNETYIEV